MHAAATALALVPDASVYPAPRSQISARTRARSITSHSCTFVRSGNAGWRSRWGPSSRQRFFVTGCPKTTQCGLPTETSTALTRPAGVSSSTCSGSPSKLAGRSAARNDGRPMSSSVTIAAPLRERTCTAFDLSAVRSSNRSGAPCSSTAWAAVMRSPLPLFWASDRSGLKIRTLIAAGSKASSPSEPRPRRACPFDRFFSSNRSFVISHFLEEFELSSQTQTKALVTTEWIAEHSKDSGLRLVEVDVDPSVYEKGHIEGAVGWNWKRDLQDQLARDIAPKDALAELLGRSGITPETAV